MSGRVFHQIAKLSGSFALAGGVSQWQKSEQQEYSLTGLVFPTTALSYSLFGSSGVQKAARLRPIRANNRDGHEVKVQTHLLPTDSVIICQMPAFIAVAKLWVCL